MVDALSEATYEEKMRVPPTPLWGEIVPTLLKNIDWNVNNQQKLSSG